MKFTWEEDDIICGRYVCQPLCDNETRFSPDGWTAKWTFKIGFIGGRSEGTVLICMADGLVSKTRTPKETADYLNTVGLIPMPHDWLVQHINYFRDAYILP